MNVIISFVGLKPHLQSTPFPICDLAGNTILGHIMVHLLDLPIKKLTLVLESGLELVREWLQTNIPNLDIQVLLVKNLDAPLSVLKNSNIFNDAESLLFIAGNYVAEVNYADFTSSPAGAALLVQPDQDAVPGNELGLDDDGFVKRYGKNIRRWAGSLWIDDVQDLARAVDAMSEQEGFDIVSLLEVMVELGVDISTEEAVYCFDTSTVQMILYANARLLSLDLGTQDAIERSYAEDFTVLPPVFLHETAVIENSVVGPFVNLEAHASVRNVIVRNSLIGSGTQITNAILGDSIIGKDAMISGRRSTLMADNDAVVDVDKL